MKTYEVPGGIMADLTGEGDWSFLPSAPPAEGSAGSQEDSEAGD